jgi:methylase of polypeptide subunit release factors
MRLPGGDLSTRLADRLHALDYSVEGVRTLVGEPAARALERDETVPATRALSADGSPLATLVRCFLLAEPVDVHGLETAVGVPTDELAGLVEVGGTTATASVELAPCSIDDVDWLIASDWSSRRTGRATAPDHVLGVGGASLMLAQCTVRERRGSALDIGTGCGIQAFQLANHCDRVVATDLSPRCLELARFNAALNSVDVELRQGSLFEPVENEQFDLIVSNPPFVIGSPTSGRHDYRDFGGVGDEVCGDVVTGAERRLTDGGWCQLLANWEITDVDDWSWHPRQWVMETGLDAWVIEREVQDPAEYVHLWLQDAGEQHGSGYRARYDEWLSSLEARGVEAVGFGVITLRRGGRDVPVRRFQHVPQLWLQPVAPDIERWFAVQDWLARDPSGPLTASLGVADDVVVEQHGWPRAESVTMLRRETGMRWSGPVDDFGLDVLAALDGSGPAAAAVAQAASAHQVPVETALEQAVPVLGRLLEEGFVTRWP